MKSFALLAATLALGLTLTAGEADAARRFGAGKSSGMQRQELSQPKSTNATPATPAQAPNAAAAPAHAQQAGAAAQPKRSWMGPLAGLAAGIGLAALASHFGFGEQLASMMMVGLIVVAAMLLIGLVMRRRAATQQPALAGAGGMHYTGNAPQANPPQASGGSAAIQNTVAQTSAKVGNIPADFNAEAFVHNAKLNFIRLQSANDTRNLDDIREYTTSELFAEIKMLWLKEGNAPQKTDIVSLNAEVIDVTEETAQYVVSVRFTGLLREDANASPETIDETWHLTKPRSGNGGWLVAGIQQNT